MSGSSTAGGRIEREKRVKRVIRYLRTYAPFPLNLLLHLSRSVRARGLGIGNHALHALHAPNSFRRRPLIARNQPENIA